MRKQEESRKVEEDVCMLCFIITNLSNKMQWIDPPISVPNQNLSCSGKTRIKLHSLLEKTVQITWGWVVA